MWRCAIDRLLGPAGWAASLFLGQASYTSGTSADQAYAACGSGDRARWIIQKCFRGPAGEDGTIQQLLKVE